MQESQRVSETNALFQDISSISSLAGASVKVEEAQTCSAKVATRYTQFLSGRARSLRPLCAVLVLVGYYLVPKFFSKMTTSVPATDGTYSEKANRLLNLHFPNKISEVVAAIVIFHPNRGPVLGPDGRGEAVSNLTDHVLGAVQTLNHTTGSVTHVDCWKCFDSLPRIQHTFLSSDNTTTFIAINYDIRKDDGRLLSTIHGSLEAMPIRLKSEFQIIVTGPDSINKASISGVISNLEYMDSIAFPAALLLLGAVLWSRRLMLLPVVAVAGAASLSFGLLMYPVSLVYPIFILASSLMMSLLIAMSIDYSLFFLSRFKEEMQAAAGIGLSVDHRVQMAVARTLESAGHTILVSGITLTLAFLGLILSHDPFMTSCGLGAGVAVISAMVAALVFIPLLLVSFPAFFDTARGRYVVDETAAQLEQTFELQEGISTNLECSGGLDTQQLRKLVSTRWYHFATLILERKACMALVIAIGLLPALLRLPSLQLAKSPLHGVPRHSDAFRGFLHLQQTFGAGSLWPHRVLVLPADGDTVWSSEVFDQVSRTIEGWSESLPVSPASVQSIAYSTEVGRIPFDTVRAVLPEITADGHSLFDEASSYALCHVTSPEACQLLRMARKRLVNEDASAMILVVEFPGDPFSPEGIEWMRALRRDLSEATSGRERYYLVSNPSSYIDTVDCVYKAAPVVVCATIAVIFVVISVSFGSLVVSLRLLPSIALTISWTYGLAVLIYQDGWMKQLGVDALSPPPKGFPAGIGWVLPALCFTILTGLCLDYDIFVLNRVCEFRLQGFNDRDALVLGLSATGHTITVAGCIMLIAFSGLLMSDQILLNQMSFFLVVTVLLDTFVVRTIVVPICMDMLGDLSNWWPRRMPPPTRSIKDLHA